MGIFDQIKDAAQAHSAEVEQGIDRLGDFVDEKTGGQHASQVDQAQDFLKAQLTADPQVAAGAGSQEQA